MSRCMARSAVPTSTIHSHVRPVSSCIKRSSRRAAVVAADADAPAGMKAVQSGPNFKALRDISQIMETLPHRYPFLLIDRVVELEKGKYAVGYKNVTVNDNFFTGHFPDRPIMPDNGLGLPAPHTPLPVYEGVLQVEALAQLAGLVMLDPEDSAAKGLFFFGGIEACRFRKPVVPGDTLMMRVEVTNKRFGIVKLDGRGYVGPDLVVEAQLTLAMGK